MRAIRDQMEKPVDNDDRHADGAQDPPGNPLGRRRRSRLHVRLSARAITLTQTRPAILCDLSLQGAQIETDALTVPGQEIVLQWGPFEAFGTIVWSAGTRCGIGLHQSLSPQTLVATRDLDDAHHLPRTSQIVRDEARRWAEGRLRP